MNKDEVRRRTLKLIEDLKRIKERLETLTALYEKEAKRLDEIYEEMEGKGLV